MKIKINKTVKMNKIKSQTKLLSYMSKDIKILLGRMKGFRGFNVNVELKESSVHGTGLFATQKIPKGTLIWSVIENENVVFINRQQFQTLCMSERSSKVSPDSFALWDTISTYSFYSASRDELGFCMDASRFWNHSVDSWNSSFDGKCSVAIRDIENGEEILENYLTYDKYVWPEPFDNWVESSGIISSNVSDIIC
jgi:hypothetical protein